MRENGVRGLKAYIIQGVNRREKPYAEWFAENMPSEEELQQQKTKIFEKQPKISIIPSNLQDTRGFFARNVRFCCQPDICQLGIMCC